MRLLAVLIPLLLQLAIPCLPARAEMVPIRKIRVGLPPFSVVEGLAQHNDQAVNAIEAGTPLPAIPAPHLTWLADSNIRLQADQLYPDAAEKVYEVRSPGGLLAPAAGSVDFGVNELHTPVLLISAATASKAIPTAGGPESRAAAWANLPQKYAAMQARKNGQLPPSQSASPDPDLAHVEQTIDLQVVEACKRYQDRVASGRVVVIGAVIDLDNRYGLGPGRMVIINVNGETDPVRLRQLGTMVQLEPRLLDMVGRRQSVRPQPVVSPVKPAKTDKGKKKKSSKAGPARKGGKGKLPAKGKKTPTRVAPAPEPEEDNPEKPAYEFKY